jgi:hypothetical protein
MNDNMYEKFEITNKCGVISTKLYINLCTFNPSSIFSSPTSAQAKTTVVTSYLGATENIEIKD